MLAQQQHGLTGRKIVAQPTEMAGCVRSEKFLGSGIRVIVD